MDLEKMAMDNLPDALVAIPILMLSIGTVTLFIFGLLSVLEWVAKDQGKR
jgi:hypothetical protein